MSAEWDTTTRAFEPDPEDRSRPSIDPSQLPWKARRALVALLSSRYLSRSRNKVAWEGLIAYEQDIRSRLDEMFLDLEVDLQAEVAFKRQREGEDIPRLLRRERALSRDSSFILIFIFQEFTYADPDDGPVVITRDQVGEFLRAFREDGDNDEARFIRRVDAAIAPLTKPLQLLTPDPAADYLLTISPVIASLVQADDLARFRTEFQRAAAKAREEAGESETPAIEHLEGTP